MSYTFTYFAIFVFIIKCTVCGEHKAQIDPCSTVQ